MIDRAAARAEHRRHVQSRALLDLLLLWSSGYVVGALAIQVADPLPLLAARFLLASLIAVPLALYGRWPAAPLGQLALVGLLLQVVQFGGIYGGLAMGVPAGVSALVMLGLSPLLTTALAVRTGQERGSRRRWTGLAIGAAGVFVGLLPELVQHADRRGPGLTSLGLVGLAGGTVLQKRVTAGVDPFVSVAVQSVTPRSSWPRRRRSSAAASTSACTSPSPPPGSPRAWASSPCSP